MRWHYQPFVFQLNVWIVKAELGFVVKVWVVGDVVEIGADA